MSLPHPPERASKRPKRPVRVPSLSAVRNEWSAEHFMSRMLRGASRIIRQVLRKVHMRAAPDRESSEGQEDDRCFVSLSGQPCSGVWRRASFRSNSYSLLRSHSPRKCRKASLEVTPTRQAVVRSQSPFHALPSSRFVLVLSFRARIIRDLAESSLASETRGPKRKSTAGERVQARGSLFQHQKKGRFRNRFSVSEYACRWAQ